MLTGLRVVECGAMVSAGYATKLMADLGAEVIKVEPPRYGDTARARGPFPAQGGDCRSGQQPTTSMRHKSLSRWGGTTPHCCFSGTGGTSRRAQQDQHYYGRQTGSGGNGARDLNDVGHDPSPPASRTGDGRWTRSRSGNRPGPE